MSELSTSNKSETVSKQLRTALITLMSDHRIRTTKEMTTDLASQNMTFNTDYNINHLWGVINTLTASEELVRVSRGHYQLRVSHEPDANTAVSDVPSMLANNHNTPGCIYTHNEPAQDSLADPVLVELYHASLNQLRETLATIETTLDTRKVSQLKSADIPVLYKISDLKESLAALLAETSPS